MVASQERDVLSEIQGRIRPFPPDPSVDTDGVGPSVWTRSTQLLLSGRGQRTTCPTQGELARLQCDSPQVTHLQESSKPLLHLYPPHPKVIH